MSLGELGGDVEGLGDAVVGVSHGHGAGHHGHGDVDILPHDDLGAGGLGPGEHLHEGILGPEGNHGGLAHSNGLLWGLGGHSN